MSTILFFNKNVSKSQLKPTEKFDDVLLKYLVSSGSSSDSEHVET